MEKKRFKKIYIEITNVCNMKCSFCKPGKRNARFMKKEEFEIVVEKIKKYTNLITLHVKGEPLIHPELLEILDICDKSNIFVNITTYGTLLKEKIEVLKNAKSLRQLNISLHSIKKSDGFQKSLNEYLSDIIAGVKMLGNKPYISYRLWNLSDIKENSENKELLELLEKEYNIENLLEKAKNNQFIELQEKVFINQDIEFTWPDIELDIINNEGTCMGLRNQIAILSNGDVVPCCLDQDGNIKLGNIFEDDLEDIINSEKCLEIIKGFEENKLIHRLCKTCGFVSKFK